MYPSKQTDCNLTLAITKLSDGRDHCVSTIFFVANWPAKQASAETEDTPEQWFMCMRWNYRVASLVMTKLCNAVARLSEWFSLIAYPWPCMGGRQPKCKQDLTKLSTNETGSSYDPPFIQGRLTAPAAIVLILQA